MLKIYKILINTVCLFAIIILKIRILKKKEDKVLATTPNNRASRGEHYLYFVENYAEELLEGLFTQKFVAEDEYQELWNSRKSYLFL